MVYAAVKRSADQTEYREHAWIDNDSRGAFVNGMTYLPRRYQIGDRIILDSGTVEVIETFEGFDFHTLKPGFYFNTAPVCRNCNKVGNHHRNGYNWAPFECEATA